MFFSKLKKLNLRSLIINLKVLPFKQALKCPVLVSRKCRLSGLKKNSIIINAAEIKPGMIQIGYDCCGIIDYKYERTSVSLGSDCKIVFKGSAIIGSACRFAVQNNGTLEIGNGTCFTGRTAILCYDNIKFGSDCLISWDCSFMDTDFHKITADGKIINQNKPVALGNKVWCGCGCTFLKGSEVPDAAVIGAGSIVSGKLPETNAVYAGYNVEIKKKNIEWEK